MQYYKKMCVLRQLKQGFSGDGRPLSGLIKAEQYGKNLSIEVSAVGFAPLSSGEYYCLIADCKNRTELLPLRGKTMFNLISELDISGGFCGVICFVKTEILPIACGVNGNFSFDIRALAEKAFLSVVKPQKTKPAPIPAPIQEPITTKKAEEKDKTEEETAATYDDEILAEENYFEEEEDERRTAKKGSGDVRLESGIQSQDGQTGASVKAHDDGQDVLNAFTTNSDGFYREIKSELDELFARYPKDESLTHAFPSSEWVRVKGSKDEPKELVGIVYEDGRAKYICYAVPNDETVPSEVSSAGFFIPRSPFERDKGFIVLYQSAATGESIKPIQE